MLHLGLLIALFGISSPVSTGPDYSECYENTFCVEAEDAGNRVEIYVRSLVDWEVTISLEVEMANMRPDTAMPLVQSMPGKKRTHALTLKVRDIGYPWSFSYNLTWIPGDTGAQHDADAVYELPFAKGTSFAVGQGYQGKETHQGTYAIDFLLPESTPVHAARGGTVVDTADRFTEGKLDPALKTAGNFVTIRHDDGTFGYYVHFQHQGVTVRAGDRVETGQLIGYSGNTGYSSGPHLHFEVFSMTKDISSRTLPIRFRTGRHGVTYLEEGQRYRR